MINKNSSKLEENYIWKSIETVVQNLSYTGYLNFERFLKVLHQLKIINETDSEQTD